MAQPVICWFRQDLRLSDNPAWTSACALKAPVIPVYIFDTNSSDSWPMGHASKVWLYHSLHALNKSLNGGLFCLKGDASSLLIKLADDFHAQKIVWNRCYEPWSIKRDKSIKQIASLAGIKTESFNASLLWEPWTIQKKDNTPYKVFTPFFRKGCLNAEPPRIPLPPPRLPKMETPPPSFLINTLDLLPHKQNWPEKIARHWSFGEINAQKALDYFIENRLKGYKEGRNFPAKNQTSKLSPSLHFGEISPHQIWHALSTVKSQIGIENDIDCFQSELVWREFAYSLLYHHPDLPDISLNKKFENFDWNAPSSDLLEKWKKGETGFPLIDAGMRELWDTGYMHNRVRMITASFLVKDLRIHWKHGEKWFWDTLLDADLANNAASWQWVAGCGADAAPFFRIFNPITQEKKFDPQHHYIQRWAPNSHKLTPILDHSLARHISLEAFKAIR